MLGSLRFASVCCRNLGASGSRGAGTRLLSAYVKNSTGITGLEVVPEYKEVLTGLYNEILDVATGIPDHAFYRQHLEQDVKAHLELLETATDVLDFEAKVGLGQAEELIAMAKDELKLLPKYIEWRAWETINERNERLEKESLE